MYDIHHNFGKPDFATHLFIEDKISLHENHIYFTYISSISIWDDTE